MPEITDHESILLLTKAVENIGRRLDEKFTEVNDKIDDLKNNYAERLSRSEQKIIDMDKVKVAKDEQDKLNKEFFERIEGLEKWRWYLVGMTAVSTPVLTWLVYKLLEHLMKG